jgi:hypothetical protein
MARPKVQRGPETSVKLTAEDRPRRVTAGERNILSVEGLKKERVYRWVNDSHGGQRIAGKQQQGWRIETDNTLEVGDASATEAAGEGAAVKRFVGAGIDGQPMFAYLMSIQRELFEEDQNYKLADIDAQEEAIFRSTPEGADYAKERSIERVKARQR